MPREVVAAQNVSRMCLVCGIQNDAGLGARFFETAGGDELVCEFTLSEHHQSYPGRAHGGITAAILDETIGRAACLHEAETWYVTVELSIRYRKPVPLDEPLKAIGRITEHRGRTFTGTGELLLPDGTVAATATGRYMKLPIERIAEGGFLEDEWFADERPLPESIDL